MLYVDIPTLQELKALISVRKDACLSIYVSTTPQTQKVGASRIAFGNLVKSGIEQLEKPGSTNESVPLLQQNSELSKMTTNSGASRPTAWLSLQSLMACEHSGSPRQSAIQFKCPIAIT